MNNNQNDRSEYFARLIEQFSFLLSYSANDLKREFVNHSLCSTMFTHNGITKESIRVRFDDYGMTVNCTFNDWSGICNRIYLLPDSREFADELILYIKNNCVYNPVEDYFDLDICSLWIIKTDEPDDRGCVVIGD